ncbi:hypothetical protein BKI52_36510 [marine bacterium AO1-C]|nr:hypothetical protein BKI52_36510 [marine bacterium AO1-C]
MERHHQNLKDFNGWESIPWNSFPEMIKQALERQSISFNTFEGLLEFTFQEMRTYLKFNELNQLREVHQSADFHLLELEKSRAFYEKIKQRLIHKYNQPQYVNDDKSKEVVSLHWYLPHTQIKLQYDYQYKVVDELGAGAYLIDVYFSPQN